MPRKAKAKATGTVDFFGHTINPGDTVAAYVRGGAGFMTLARRKVVSIDADGALVCTNMDGKPVNRILNPKKTFKHVVDFRDLYEDLADHANVCTFSTLGKLCKGCKCGKEKPRNADHS